MRTWVDLWYHNCFLTAVLLIPPQAFPHFFTGECVGIHVTVVFFTGDDVLPALSWHCAVARVVQQWGVGLVIRWSRVRSLVAAQLRNDSGKLLTPTCLDADCLCHYVESLNWVSLPLRCQSTEGNRIKAPTSTVENCPLNLASFLHSLPHWIVAAVTLAVWCRFENLTCMVSNKSVWTAGSCCSLRRNNRNLMNVYYKRQQVQRAFSSFKLEHIFTVLDYFHFYHTQWKGELTDICDWEWLVSSYIRMLTSLSLLFTFI